MKFLVRRFGSKLGRYDRLGLWFEIISSSKARFTQSAYKHIFGLTSSSAKLYYAFVEINHPYFFVVKDYNEGQYPIALYAQVFNMPYDDALEYKRELENIFVDDRDVNAFEAGFAELEKEIWWKLKTDGYDSVMFIKNLYDEVLFNSNDTTALEFDQIFYFYPNLVEWLD